MKKHTLNLILIMLMHSVANSQSINTTAILKSKGLGIQIIFSEKVDSIFKPVIEQSVEIAMQRFNAEKHLIQAHYNTPEDSVTLVLNFCLAKFRSEESRTAGCVFTWLGMTALPYLVYKASKGEFFLFAWYLPRDKMNLIAKLNPTLGLKYKSSWTVQQEWASVTKGVIKRKDAVAKFLIKRIYKILNKINYHVILCSPECQVN